ncbi:thioredoxin family protein [Paraburkholderia pallida]|uniref:Thioredoxin family protein n=1 Tax=Paraburkholderia pallida TaxID=2547399 RepID=A0A4P7D3K5_9BURK|nr:thioredoxin family protein [Paraburkholderia pallida]QBR01114.1 thioredoxin family protein [Paraburkholderia pallida]
MFDRLKIAAAVAAFAGLAATGAWAAFASDSNPAAEPAAVQTGASAPDFTGTGAWLNSAPLDLKQLRGKVVLVEFWTFDCINCAHTVPYVKDWYARYRDKGLVVVGVHTPEYPFERDTGNLKKAVARFGIQYPVVQDNQYATWNAYGNQYWPALYLIDKNGKVVYRQVGEGHYEETEQAIRGLLGVDGKQG